MPGEESEALNDLEAFEGDSDEEEDPRCECGHVRSSHGKKIDKCRKRYCFCPKFKEE